MQQVHKAIQLLARRAQPVIPDPQAVRAQREIQVQQDLKVLQATREQLDQRVRQAIQARRVRKASKV